MTDRDPPPLGAAQPPTRSEIVAAAPRVYRFARQTPLVRDPVLSDRFGAEVFLKLETEQPVGSFKIRGAAAKLTSISATEVVAASSGNHGLAVAHVARRLGLSATVVLPERVNPAKLSAVRAEGARVLYCGTSSEERGTFARRYAESTGATLIPSFDDPEILAGQGTVGLELEASGPWDLVICPVGGGGLLGGIGRAFPEERRPALFGVQPEGAPSMQVSLARGVPTSVEARTLADGIAVSRPGALTFAAVRSTAKEILLVDDDEILVAARELFRGSERLVEPASAATLAALTRYRDRLLASRPPRPRIVLVLTGRNVSDAMRRTITGPD